MRNVVLMCLVAAGIVTSCQEGTTRNQVAETKVVHDTVFIGDTVIVHDTIVVKEEKYYDGKWLQRKFETCEWKLYESSEYGFVVSYPEFMVKNLNLTSERSVFVEYKDMRLIVKAYKDDVSVEEKFKELSKSATTKSMGENYFLIAGKTSDVGRFFEKDIKMDGYWLYIRAEFPQEFTPYIDMLLQGVKNYGSSI